MCNRIQVGELESFTRGALVQLAVGMAEWTGYARMETLNKKFPEYYGWRVVELNASTFWNTVYQEGQAPDIVQVNLPELQRICVVYRRGEFRVVTREATRSEKILLGKERVPVVRNQDYQKVYFSKRHVYQRIEWR